MRGTRLLFFKFVIISIGRSSASDCDMATIEMVQEGNLGQSPDFNWLGVLKVHLHDGDKWQVAISGIIRIKTKYALANADDVARIPQRVFKTDSEAMFITAQDTPWYVTLASYVTHPEYGHSTFNSIAIIELNVYDTEDFPLKPVCFNIASFTPSTYLYLVGFTDQNERLEKEIYKIQYLDKQVCEEFYDKTGLSANNRVPTSYICGHAPSNSTHCIWDNGMALVSNATGYFNLIGFGVHGPGCAAPARFINLYPYFSWINSVTNSVDEDYDSSDYRRKDDDEFMPIHELFAKNGFRRLDNEAVMHHEYIKYPFDVVKPRHFTILPTEDNGTIEIFKFHEMHERYTHACNAARILMYKEYFELKTRKEMRGVTTYKLSMYDLKDMFCVCVRLTVDCDKRSEAVLSFREEIDFASGTSLTDSGETPEEIFRYYPVTERTVKPTGPREFKFKDHLTASFIKDNYKRRRALSYDLYIKFEFTERAILNFEMYAYPVRPTTTTTTTEPSLRRAFRISASSTKKRRQKYYWGMSRVNKMLKEPEVTLVADQEVVQETVSGGRRSKAGAGLIVLGCLLINFHLRRAVFID